MNEITSFSIGGILGRAWRMTREAFFPLSGILLTLYLPPLLILILVVTLMVSSSGAEVLSPDAAVALVFGAMALSMVAGLVATAALIHAIFERLRGRAISIGDALGVGLRRAPNVVLLSLVVGLIVLVGTALLVIPGIIAMTWLAMALPIVIVERPGKLGLGALGRSIHLTKGHAWDVFALFLLVLFISYGVVALAQFTIILPALIHPALVVVGLIVMLIAQVVVQIFSHICLVMAYHDLRALKEGVDTDDLAAVFE